MARGQIFSADDARWTDNFQFLLAGAHPRLQKRIRGNSTKNVTRSTVARGQLFSADDALWTDNLQIFTAGAQPGFKNGSAGIPQNVTSAAVAARECVRVSHTTATNVYFNLLRRHKNRAHSF